MIVTVWRTLTDRRAHHLSGIMIVTVLPPSGRGQTVTIMDEPRQKHTRLGLAVPARFTPSSRLGPCRLACRGGPGPTDRPAGAARPLRTALQERPGPC